MNYWDEYFKSENLEEKLQEKFKELVDSFKVRVEKQVRDVISDLEVDFLPFLFEDTCSNLRNNLIDALRSDALKDLRDQIFKEHREEIVDDKIKNLEEDVESYKKWYNDAISGRF